MMTYFWSQVKNVLSHLRLEKRVSNYLKNKVITPSCNNYLNILSDIVYPRLHCQIELSKTIIYQVIFD